MINSDLLAQINGVSFDSISGVGPFGTGSPDEAPTLLTTLFSTVFGFLTIIAGLAFVLYFVLGAIAWITSGGDQAKVEEAKNKMTSAAVGLIIVVAAYAIIGIVSAVLGIDILNFTSFLDNPGGT